MHFRGPEFLFLLVVTCVASMPAAEVISEPFAGVRYLFRTQAAPRPLQIHLVEIELTHPGISFLISPSNGAATGENSARTVRSFVNSVGAKIGINASFFLTSAAGANLDNRGVVASRGDIYSPFDGDNRPWPVLNLAEDNFARIVSQAVQPSTTTAVTPYVPLFNAVSGSERIITNGRNTAGAVSYGEPATLQPRTVAGITSDRRLILAAIDGRRSGISEGMLSREVAELLLAYDVVDAVNLDGGGSTTLVFSDPTPRVLNSPSDGSERAVGASLAVFAGPAVGGIHDAVVYADFFRDEQAGFTRSPGAAGEDAAGLRASSTSVVTQSAQSGRRAWFQRLTLHDDPAIATVPTNLIGGWALRHAWNVTAGGLLPRPSRGRIGFWARTSTPAVHVALAINRAAVVVRSVRRNLPGDGQWHLCEWDLGETADWAPRGNGGSAPDNSTFTLDAIHFDGPNADAVIDLDDVAHNALGSIAAELTPVESGRLANLAVRSTLTAIEPSLLVGFSVTPAAEGAKTILLRAAGPALLPLGVSDAVTNPRLVLFDRTAAWVAANDNWEGAPALTGATTRLGAFPFGRNSLDAATLVSCDRGGFTVQVTGANQETGSALVEIYDATEGFSSTSARLANLSARVRIGAGGVNLVGGFVISGGMKRILVRAIGPGLSPFGVSDLLSDPQISLYAGSVVHAINDDWGGGPLLTETFGRAGAFALPTTSRDAALLTTLPPGAYSAHVQSANGSAGTVLLEVYEVP